MTTLTTPSALPKAQALRRCLTSGRKNCGPSTSGPSSLGPSSLFFSASPVAAPASVVAVVAAVEAHIIASKVGVVEEEVVEVTIAPVDLVGHRPLVVEVEVVSEAPPRLVLARILRTGS